jgi:hypothetical protein
VKRIIGRAIWRFTEYWHIPLGRKSPIVFGWMIGAKKGRKLTDREVREWHMGIYPEKHCPFCGKYECVDDDLEEVVDGDAVLTDCIRCGYCGVCFLMGGVDFNKREGNNG